MASRQRPLLGAAGIDSLQKWNEMESKTMESEFLTKGPINISEEYVEFFFLLECQFKMNHSNVQSAFHVFSSLLKEL